MVGTIIICFLVLHIIMAAIMAVFPRDEGMRNTIGFQAYTPEPKSAGDYIFNGLFFLLAAGAYYMESINERIAKKYWLARIGIRIAVLSVAVVVVFILALIGSVINEI
ncbi:hypothetical protein BBD41_01400 [Paenibacillus ihbetae]|uniref:Uncharacterized protein n=1 Tax=Paenibacillus ihbetae TaxID=1870820 RepID=A0A1B2DUF9_9BACL|nr:hypothetical protein [Paenibacillus ihbetae]ANY71344.1 hypothetical protein BBD41_01400 [Paenibacillus ihbetae]